MLLVRVGGLLFAGLLVFGARTAIDDGADRAPSRDYLSPASFAAVVGQIERALGSDAELPSLTVSKRSGGNVMYRTGARAAGFVWGPGHIGLHPVKVKLVGSGKLADNVFPIAKLDAAATAKLTAETRARAGADFDVRTMTLGLDPATGRVKWTVTGDANGRPLVFIANADASKLERYRPRI
jgi:hypothetical protein